MVFRIEKVPAHTSRYGDRTSLSSPAGLEYCFNLWEKTFDWRVFSNGYFKIKLWRQTVVLISFNPTTSRCHPCLPFPPVPVAT